MNAQVFAVCSVVGAKVRNLKETSSEASNKYLRRHTNAKDDFILVTYGGYCWV